MELKLTTTKEELKQILALQNENHYDNLSNEAKSNDGFVTVKHNLDLLVKMNSKAKQVIAVDNGKVIGYALVMPREFKELIPVLVPMFNTFKKVLYQNSKLNDLNFYVMGQVCIYKEYRGQGIFKELYQKHKEVYSSKFNLCVTEVSSSNIRSMKAHEKVGFKTIHTFKDITDEWNILAWDYK